MMSATTKSGDQIRSPTNGRGYYHSIAPHRRP